MTVITDVDVHQTSWYIFFYTIKEKKRDNN